MMPDNVEWRELEDRRHLRWKRETSNCVAACVIAKRSTRSKESTTCGRLSIRREHPLNHASFVECSGYDFLQRRLDVRMLPGGPVGP
jgi:hypothetical protein